MRLRFSFFMFLILISKVILSQTKEELKMSVYFYNIGESYLSIDEENTILLQKILIDRLFPLYDIKAVPLMYVLPEGEKLDDFMSAMVSDVRTADMYLDSIGTTLEPDIIMVGYAFKRGDFIYINIHHILGNESFNIIKETQYLKEFKTNSFEIAFESYIEVMFGLKIRPIITEVFLSPSRNRSFNKLDASVKTTTKPTIKSSYAFLKKSEYENRQDYNNIESLFEIYYPLQRGFIADKLYFKRNGYLISKTTSTVGELMSNPFYQVHKIFNYKSIGVNTGISGIFNEFYYDKKVISNLNNPLVGLSFQYSYLNFGSFIKYSSTFTDSLSVDLNDITFYCGGNVDIKSLEIENNIYFNSNLGYRLNYHSQSVDISRDGSRLINDNNYYYYHTLFLEGKIMFVANSNIIYAFKIIPIYNFSPSPIRISDNLENYKIDTKIGINVGIEIGF